MPTPSMEERLWGQQLQDKLATDADGDFIVRKASTQLDEHGEIATCDFSIDGLELVREKKGFLNWHGEFAWEV